MTQFPSIKSIVANENDVTTAAEQRSVMYDSLWYMIESASRRFTHNQSNTTRILNTRRKERLHCFNYFLAAATITVPHRDRFTPRQQKLFHIQKLAEMWRSDTTQSTTTLLFIRRPNREHGAGVIISVGERSDESMNGRISSQSACACARPATPLIHGEALRSGHRRGVQLPLTITSACPRSRSPLTRSTHPVPSPLETSRLLLRCGKDCPSSNASFTSFIQLPIE